ncbi:unnamed protein product, partial [Rotaria sp. Silwood2]
IRNSH